MSFTKYAVIVSGVVGGSLLAVWAVPSLEGPARWAAALGGTLAGLNSLAAYGLAIWAAPRSNVVFLRALLGGMIGRLAFLLGAVVLAILAFDLPRLPLTVSLLAYFAGLLAFELSVLHRTTKPAVAR